MTENFMLSNKRMFFLVTLLFTIILSGNEPINGNLFAQEKGNDFFVVDSIQIFGNETTKDYIILRELTFTKGDTVNEAVLKFNKERVYSLGIFNKVKIFRLKRVNKNYVLILVKESWYIYPLPMLAFQNSQWDKISYGIDFLWKNFRGRNETLHLVAAFGYDPVYAVNYFVPVVDGLKNISFAGQLSFNRTFNKSKSLENLVGGEFKFKSYSGMIGFGKRLNQFNEVFISLGFQYTEQPFESLASFTASGNKIDRMPMMKLNYLYDTRDLKQFSSGGTYFQTGYFQKGFGVNDISYNILDVDYRRYQPVAKKFTAKLRLLGRHVWGKRIPFYDRSYFGYNEIIRGHSLDYTEGDNYFKTSFDLNYSILDEWNFTIKLPLIPQKLTSARIGINVSIFYDAGSTFNNGDIISRLKFQSGYGVGMIILFLPYNALRVEYALNEKGKGEILIGTGFAF